MQGFLFSCPLQPGQGLSPLTASPVVVAYERFGAGQLLFSWPLLVGRGRRTNPIRLVIVYEDFATGCRALRGCRRLAKEVGVGFDQALWRFDILQRPQPQRRAMREITEADLLILSVHRYLPVGTSALLAAWLEGKKRRDSALIALLDYTGARPEAGRSAFARLSRLARAHELAFIRAARDEASADPERDRLELLWIF